jgi:crossover junction endodeoxyribonuclease RuvC
MPESVRILGIDPGSRFTGYAVIDVVGVDVSVVTHGVLKLPQKEPLTERLKLLDTLLRQLSEEHCPDEVAVEEAFVAVNARSALVLAQVRGVVIVAAGAACPVFEYSARAVKKAVAGYGQADKNQVVEMVKTLLHLGEAPPQDAADALALALCHMYSRRFTALLEGAR